MFSKIITTVLWFTLTLMAMRHEGVQGRGRSNKERPKGNPIVDVPIHTREIFSESSNTNQNLNCNYPFPIDLAPNGIPFRSKIYTYYYIYYHIKYIYIYKKYNRS